MFQNNIKGNQHKIKINQNANQKDSKIIQIIIGIIIAVIGGLILYFIIGG